MRKLALPLILFLAACGDDGGNNNHADAGPDSQDIDADPGAPVKITITTNGTGVAGVRVHFQNPDSTVVLSAMTDTAGVASSPMPNGGFVTAINPFSSAPGGDFASLTTFAGVKAGDALELTDDFGGAGTNLTVIAPIDSTAGVTNYLFSTPCDRAFETSAGTSTATQAMLSLAARCATSTDLLVASLDDSGEIVHYLYIPNQATTGGTLDLSSMSLTTAPTTKTLTFNNIPTAGNIEIHEELDSLKGRVFETQSNPTGTSFTQMMKLPAFANALDIAGVELETMYASHVVADWGPFATTYTVDVGARMLRDATAGATYDAATHQITWTEAATGVAPDFVVGGIDAFREASSLYIDWSLIAPAGAAVVQFPTLPVETTDYNVGATDMPDTHVELGKLPGGYDAIRATFFTTSGFASLTTSASGGLVFEEIDGAGAPFRGKKATHKPVLPWQFRRRM